MRHEITEHGNEIEMRVTDTKGRGPGLLAAMQECQDGRCGCPTDQYERLEGMDIQTGDEGVTVTLRPRPGERLDVDELEACLEYTVAKAETE